LIKTLIVLGSVVAVVVWLTGTKTSQAVGRSGNDDKPAASEYVGSETCQACHEDTFKAYSHTAHATLTRLSSWKDKATGCESCHGPGKPTSTAVATRQRSSPSPARHQKRFLKLVSVATPARKSAITS